MVSAAKLDSSEQNRCIEIVEYVVSPLVGIVGGALFWIKVLYDFLRVKYHERWAIEAFVEWRSGEYPVSNEAMDIATNAIDEASMNHTKKWLEAKGDLDKSCWRYLTCLALILPYIGYKLWQDKWDDRIQGRFPREVSDRNQGMYNYLASKQ